ncbi:DMT family transporter [Halocatena marina]|uniref:DMT family transporter n=1 Tax=Halocatena marina TaxID=2934937 RepID=A0ABD5YZN5_9EURY|nr:DMT family transporter [Halocatena marina]
MSTYRNGGLFLLLSVLWGIAFMAIKAGLEFMPPVLFAAIRYDIAGIIMLGYAVAATEYWRPRTRTDWITVLVGATLVIAFYNAFLFIGEQGMTSGVAAIFVAMNPILATGFSWVFLPNERLTPVAAIGLGLGFVGVGFVASPNLSNLLGTDLIAPGFVLLAAVCVALGSVQVLRFESGISTEGMVAWSNALGAIILHIVSFGLPTESLAQAEFTTGALLAVVYLAIFASAIGYFIYFDLLDRLGAIEINLVSYAAPVFAATSGWVVLGETLSFLTIVGFIVIFAGFVLLKRDRFRNELPSLPQRFGQREGD